MRRTKIGAMDGRGACCLLMLAVAAGGAVGGLLQAASIAQAETKTEKTFTAVMADAQGVDTEIRNLIFYWEEKVSETAFVPHELRHLPVKRRSTTNNIPFDKIKQVEAKPAGSEGITMPGSFRGESDFGEADVPAKSVAKAVIK